MKEGSAAAPRGRAGGPRETEPFEPDPIETALAPVLERSR